MALLDVDIINVVVSAVIPQAFFELFIRSLLGFIERKEGGLRNDSRGRFRTYVDVFENKCYHQSWARIPTTLVVGEIARSLPFFEKIKIYLYGNKAIATMKAPKQIAALWQLKRSCSLLQRG